MSILAAVDNTQHPSRTLSVAHELAEDLDEELIVLHVLPKETADRRMDDRSEYYLDDAKEDAEQIAREVVADTLREDGAVRVKGRVGSPTEEILEEAARDRVRYLVIGGRKRTPVGKAIFGSVTQSVLLEAEKPVMSVMVDKTKVDEGRSK